MKSLNLKKVIAVGAGLALVAASVSAAVGWSDIADATNKNMLVNGMVVGASADVSDTIAATKLAAAFAAKAVSTVPGVETSEYKMTPECTSVSGSEFSGDSKKYDTTALALPMSAVLTYTQLGEEVLGYEPTLSYKIGGATYEAYAKESISFNVTPTFDTSSKVQRLNAEFGSADLNYDVAFGATNAGIDFNSDSAFTTTTWTDAGASDKVEVPFLGKTYVVHKVTLSGSTIEELELFEKGAIKTFKKGDKIEGLKGKDGKTYSAMLTGVIDSSTEDADEVLFSLYDSTGAVVADYESEKIGESEKFAEDVLESILEVTDIYNLGTSDVPDWQIEVAVGAEAVTVKDGSGYPYDSTKTSTSDYDWTATIVESFENEEIDLTQIVLNKTTKTKLTNEDGLAVGEFAKFPGDLAILKFVGLQLPEFSPTNPKEVHTFEFGADVEDGSGTGIKYVDSAETSHEVPFYYELTVDDADSADSNISNTGYKVDSFVFDGKTYSLKIDYSADTNMDIYLYEGSYAASATTEMDSIYDYNELINKGVSESQLGINNSEDDAIQYSFFTANVADGTVWLLLGAQEIADTWDSGSDITIVGTDVNTEAANFSTIDVNAYAPADNGDFETAYAALGTAGAEFDDSYASIFKMTVDLAAASSISMAMDTETGRALAYGASSNASNAIPGAGSQLDDDYNSADLQLKKGATNGLEEFYDEYGVKASIDADDVISLVIPDAQALYEMMVVGKGGTATETCVDVNKLVTVAGVDVTTPFTGFSSTVMLDTEVTGTGNYVVVGGYAVNSLWAAKDAAETATVFGSALAKDGDIVVQKLGNNVYIAGYTKEDTTKAAEDLIAILSAPE